MIFFPDEPRPSVDWTHKTSAKPMTVVRVSTALEPEYDYDVKFTNGHIYPCKVGAMMVLRDENSKRYEFRIYSDTQWTLRLIDSETWRPPWFPH